MGSLAPSQLGFLEPQGIFSEHLLCPFLPLSRDSSIQPPSPPWASFAHDLLALRGFHETLEVLGPTITKQHYGCLLSHSLFPELSSAQTSRTMDRRWDRPTGLVCPLAL